MEQPDIIFSVEQTRCGQLPKAEPQSPALPPDDRDSDHEQLVAETEDAGHSPRNAADLFFTLKDPEELLQLAPEPGDCVVPLPGGETQERHFC